MNTLPWVVDVSFSTRLTLALLHFIWQGCCGGILVIVGGSLLRNAEARYRYLMNVAVMLVMAVCLPVTFVLSDIPDATTDDPAQPRNIEPNTALDEFAASTAAPTVPSTPGIAASSPPIVESRLTSETRRPPDDIPASGVFPRWLLPVFPVALTASRFQLFSRWVTTLYLLGVALVLGRLLRGVLGGHRLRTVANVIDDAELLKMVAEAAGRLGLKVVPTIAWCGQISVPVVVGIIRPMILLPMVVVSGLTPHQLHALLLHELAHIRRFDPILNLFQRIIEAVLFFHPVIWFVSHRISIERELAADDMVLAAGWERPVYADALVRVAELASAITCSDFAPRATVLSASGSSPSEFKLRVLRLMEEPQPPKLGLSSIGILVTMSLVSLGGMFAWSNSNLSEMPSNVNHAVGDSGSVPDQVSAEKPDAPDAKGLTPSSRTDESTGERSRSQAAPGENAESGKEADVNASETSLPIATENGESLISNSLGMRLKRIPAGEFAMGSAMGSARGSGSDAKPQHQVRITQPFWLGIHEVTQSQYETVVGVNPSSFSQAGRIGYRRLKDVDTTSFPVNVVSWFDAVEFCNRLSTREGRTHCYKLTEIERKDDGFDSIKSARVEFLRGTGYRLPTEAEWEYACRAGGKELFRLGDTINGEDANIDGSHPTGPFSRGPNLNRPTAVGSYRENAFGLFDMLGNVYEWCADVYDQTAYSRRTGVTSDPFSTEGSRDRVMRGGSWSSTPVFARPAARHARFPHVADSMTGFRVVLGVSAEPGKEPDMSSTEESLAADAIDPGNPSISEAEKQLHGTWKVLDVQYKFDVGNLFEDGLAKGTVTFSNDGTLSRTVEGGESEGTFTVRTDQNPKQLDVTLHGMKRLGIYRLEENKLTWCFNAVHPVDEKRRPNLLELRNGDGNFLLVMQRVAPGTDGQNTSQSNQEEKPQDPAQVRIRRWAAILVDGMTDAPLQGITLRTSGVKEGERERQLMTVTSDAQGRIEVPLADGTGTTVHVTSAGWWTHGMPVLGVFPRADNAKDRPPVVDPAMPARIKLWRGTYVTGRLLSPDGTPASAVTLNVGVYLNNGAWKKRLGMDLTRYTFDHGDWPNWKTQVVTAADGTFHTTVPPADARSWVRVGTTQLGFTAIDPAGLKTDGPSKALFHFAPFEIEDGGSGQPSREEQERLEFGTLTLKRGIVLSGRVLDANGQPLTGVSLRTSGKHGPYSGRSAVSGKNGRFEFLPMNPGGMTLSVDARLRNDKGEVRSRDVQAVFVPQEVTLPESDETHEIILRALPHVMLEFEWIDRRAKKGPVSYYGEFTVSGRVPRAGTSPAWWSGKTEKVERDGHELLMIKVPSSLTNATLGLPADQIVTASYADDKTKSGPGQIELGDPTIKLRRIIYGDDPK